MAYMMIGVLSGLTDAPVSRTYSKGRDREFPDNYVTR